MKVKPYLGRRVTAGIIDYTLILLFTLVYISSFGVPSENGGVGLKGWAALLPVVTRFALSVFCEISLGATLGNSIVGLRPIPESGEIRKLTFLESFKRHLLDQIDIGSAGITAFITINSSSLHQRIGDIWAKTIVVSEKDFKLAK